MFESIVRRSRAPMGATVFAVLIGVGVAVPASAEGNVVFRDHLVIKDTHIEQEEHGDEFCDVPYLVRWDGRANVMETATRRGGGELEYFRFHVSSRDTYTNVETGESFHTIGSFTTGDQKLSLDGDILTVQAMDRLNTKLFDPDGKLVAIDSGMVTFDLVIDLNDLENPDDDEVLSETVTKDHGLRGFGVDRDFCTDVETFLG